MATIEDLYTAAKELTTLYPRLSEQVHTTASPPRDPDTPRHHTTVYKAPWNTPAGELKHDIHTQLRRYETALNTRLFAKATYRGPSDTLTIEGFNRLAILIDTAHTKHINNTDVDDAKRLLTSWPRRIRLALDEPLPGEEPWTKVPGNLCCPKCDQRLFLQPGWKDHPGQADAICRHCTNEDGHHLRWPAETWTLVLSLQA